MIARGSSSGHALGAAVLLVLAGSAPASHAYFTDFTAGDAGWSRYDPLAAFGAPAGYQFPANAYRILAGASPAPTQLGPARAGSLRTDITYTDFVASADLADWNAGYDQAMGLMARVTSPGLGTTNGYSFTYSAGGHDLVLARLSGESPLTLARAQISLTPDSLNPPRLLFTGTGAHLVGQVFSAADLSTPLASVSFDDATYAAGTSGLITFDNTAFGSIGTDATFANFMAVPEPNASLIVGVACAAWLCGRRRPEKMALLSQP